MSKNAAYNYDNPIKTRVKWGKETIDISFIPSNGVKALKTHLEEKTGVPADRMKLMPKSKGLWKGILKDEFDLTSINFQSSSLKSTIESNKPIQILLMGSAGKLTVDNKPKVKTIFLEDLPEEEAAKVAPEPSGLENLGNTCYLNSVMQCLRTVPTLRSALTSYRPSSADNDSSSSMSAISNMATANRMNNRLLLKSMKDMYYNLDRSTQPHSPTPFVISVKTTFPQFAQTDAQGRPMQQDAEEFYSSLMDIIAQETRSRIGGGGNSNNGSGGTGMDLMKSAFKSSVGRTDYDVVEEGGLGGADNLVDAIFGIKMEETLTCDEFAGVDSAVAAMTAATTEDTATTAMDVDDADDKVNAMVEQPKVTYDLHRKLVCNIQGGGGVAAQTNVTHIMEGITLSLNGNVQKRSEILDRDADWTRRTKIDRLPPVLMVQFGRFYWKETPDSQDHQGVKCKIMKPVAFEGSLDVYDFCSDRVKKILKKSRDEALKREEDEITKNLLGKTDGDDGKKEDAKEATEDVNMDNEADEEDEDLKAAMAMSMQTEETEAANDPPQVVGPGLPPDFQGRYELFAIVTHKGRDADGGHYMGWVKAEQQSADNEKISDTDETNDDWFVFDDDQVSPCKTEDVLKLKGGGDWHMSYLNFYRAKK